MIKKATSRGGLVLRAQVAPSSAVPASAETQAARPQVASYADDLQKRVLTLETRAIQLALRFGLASDDFPLEAVTGTRGGDVSDFPLDRAGKPLVPGAIVKCPQFGRGALLSLETLPGGLLATVEFEAQGRKKVYIEQLEVVIEAPKSLQKGDAATAVLASMMLDREWVAIERQNGSWGLYYHRVPSFLRGQASSMVTVLHDAPLRVRERFLEQSETFFVRYIEMCRDRVQSMRRAVAAADRTLAMLDGLDLD